MSASLDIETKRIVEAALDRFVDEAYEPSARHARLRRGAVDHRLHWPTLAELGVLSLPVSEAQGGIGGSTQDLADAVRTLARGLPLEPLVECAAIASAVLRAAQGAGEADLADLMAGSSLIVLVGGGRGQGLRCRSVGHGYQIDGMARVVPGAGQADVWLIACQGDDGSDRVLRAAPQTLAAQVQRYRMMDGREACDIAFEATPLPPDAVLLEGAAASTALAQAAAQALSAYCADAVGAMQALVAITGDYLRTRQQFGVPLASFQALQHRYADMHMAALESRAIARELAARIDAGDAARIEWLRYAAPAVIGPRGERIGHEAIQMHGGMGVTDELVVSHYNARLVVLNQLLARWAATPQAH